MRVLEPRPAPASRCRAPGGGCCGALHIHAGLADDAARLAGRVMASFPGDAPILVDSAGCGAALKDYGHLLGTPRPSAFTARVLDVHEWLAPRLDRLPARRAGGCPGWSRSRTRATCATSSGPHAARARRCWRPFVDVVELDDDGLCCGAGGAYSMLAARAGGDDPRAQARRHRPHGRERSWPAPTRAARCTSAAGGVDVRHPIELIDRAIGLADGR